MLNIFFGKSNSKYLIKFLTNLCDTCDFIGPKIIQMDSSGVNVAYKVRRWCRNRQVRIFYDNMYIF